MKEFQLDAGYNHKAHILESLKILWSFSVSVTLGQKPSFYPEISKNLMFENCGFCEKWGSEIVNFVKNKTLKMWILWKKWDIENVNSIKSEVFKMWIFG